MQPRVNVFEADPDLVRGLEAGQRAALQPRGVVEMRVYGARGPGPDAARPTGGFGLLVLDGLLSRRVSLAGRSSLELLGRGDLLRPWDDSRSGAPVPITAAVQTLTETRVAVLDHAFAARVGEWPEVADVLCCRLVDRARWLTLHLIIARLPHVEARLLVLFWHLADRWGRVQRDGSVLVPLRLTHETLGALVSAERPTVTVALKRLTQRGAVERRADHWLLHGAPPTEGDLDRQAFVEAFGIGRG